MAEVAVVSQGGKLLTTTDAAGTYRVGLPYSSRIELVFNMVGAKPVQRVVFTGLAGSQTQLNVIMQLGIRIQDLVKMEKREKRAHGSDQSIT